MRLTEQSAPTILDLKDEEGRVYVTAWGQPGSNTWTIRCPDEYGAATPYIIAHGNPEKQVRAFLASLSKAFNRHAESE